jgi:hypothetical protein
MVEKSQVWLIENGFSDIILNDHRHTKPSDRIYLSDALKMFSEKQNAELKAELSEVKAIMECEMCHGCDKNAHVKLEEANRMNIEFRAALDERMVESGVTDYIINESDEVEFRWDGRRGFGSIPWLGAATATIIHCSECGGFIKHRREAISCTCVMLMLNPKQGGEE